MNSTSYCDNTGDICTYRGNCKNNSNHIHIAHQQKIKIRLLHIGFRLRKMGLKNNPVSYCDNKGDMCHYRREL